MNPSQFKKILKRRVKFLVNPLAQYVINAEERRVNKYAKFYEELQVRKNTILYESRDGESITDSPYAMFKYMVDHPDFKDYIHIWSIKDEKVITQALAKYKTYHNVQFVLRNSVPYLQYLATCEYLINNSTFQSFVIPKHDQFYINTWHGTPLKFMGFDIPGDPYHSKNVLRNFLSTNYMLSPNPHTTQIFAKSYKLHGLYEGEIIEEGYPRIDLTLNTDPQEVINELKSQFIEWDERKPTLLYAPTWKGERVSRVHDDLPQIVADLFALKKQVGDQYNITVKVHPFLYKEAHFYPEIKNYLISDSFDTNELLSAVDILVTDYSSIFFDFLVTNRPILFYTWDKDQYKEERGQYLEPDELPGPHLFNCSELIEAIKNIETVSIAYREKYIKMREAFTPYEDGHVTERIVRYIFQSSTEPLNIISSLPDNKERILIYPGGLKPNGITSSVLNLLNNIDYDHYDVTCLSRISYDQDVLNNLEKINKNVRLVFRTGKSVYRVSEVYRDNFIQNRGAYEKLGKKVFPEQAYRRESLRLFGKTHFDYAIDFNGYSLYWAKYLIASQSKRKICYMHNDLLSDSERTVNGRRPHRLNLRGMFTLYDRFDKLVSVSEGTMEVNRKNLSLYADDDQFDYVLNSINPSHILHLAHENKQEISTEEEKTDSIEDFISRAKVIDFENARVWNTLLKEWRPLLIPLEAGYDQAEISVSRKGNFNGGTYYKFSYNHQIIGWINEEAIEFLPDSIIEEKEVHLWAKLSRTNNYEIYSLPYQVQGCYTVSKSNEYKNLVVLVDKVAQTEHGRYCRISIKQTTLGWINEAALNVFNSLTIVETASLMERFKKGLKRRGLLAYNYRKKSKVVQNLPNRTLRETEFSEPAFAIIKSPQDFYVWTKPGSHVKAEKIMAASELENQVVQIKTIKETKQGTFCLFYINNKKMGWLNREAFEWTDAPIMVETQKEDTRLKPDADDLNFVNVGRLSPEKGQDQLIHAFARFHARHEKSKLFILGKGPLRKQLEDLIKELGQEDSIFLLGQLDNPFYFMNQCDCFVLSSHYEGQPMVLLEAMTLGMPVIATDIVANRTVLQDGKYGYLVENSIEGLEKSMEDFLLEDEEGKQEKVKFDPIAYNKMAMDSFYEALK